MHITYHIKDVIFSNCLYHRFKVSLVCFAFQHSAQRLFLAGCLEDHKTSGNEPRTTAHKNVFQAFEISTTSNRFKSLFINFKLCYTILEFLKSMTDQVAIHSALRMNALVDLLKT